MEHLVHFLKHLLGFCGEPHPSLMMGGAGIFGYCIYYIKNATKRSKK